MTDPTPTPTAPDWKALCQELRDALDNVFRVMAGEGGTEHISTATDVLLRADAALATPPAPPLEPRGCPLPGACSCPTAPIVPPELIRALELADEALTDPCLELSLRVIHQVTHIRQALQTWRDHATPPAATREAGPLPREEAEISDEELADVASAAGLAWETWEDGLFIFARAVLARWGGAAVPVSDGWPEFSDCDDFERVHCFNPVLGHWKLSKINPSIHTHWLPYWALPVPAAAAGEVQP